MFLLFGTRTSEALMTLVAFACGFCGTNAQQQVIKRSTKFTLFFVPLFPIRSTYYNRCTHCRGVTDLTRAQADHAVAHVAGSPVTP